MPASVSLSLIYKYVPRLCVSPQKRSMAKRFKLRLSIPSLHFCRPKDASSLPISPLPLNYILPPFNSKSFDISYPNFPKPPPSSPSHPTMSKSKITKPNNDCKTGFLKQFIKTESPEYDYSWEEKKFTCRKMHNSPVSSDSEEEATSTSQVPDKKKKKEGNGKKKPTANNVCMSITSSGESSWFNTSEGGKRDEETESIISFSRSFDSSYDFVSSLETEARDPGICRMKCYRSNERMMSEFRVHGKVSESFVVVRRSNDPYEDFRKAMVEIILEKQLFETNELEQLLQCFLSLNARKHHVVIVEAFSEIWEVLFSKFQES